MEFAPLLLFVVPCWLIGCVFFEYFVRPKVDSVSHTRIGQRGLNWRKDHNRRRIAGGGAGKIGRGKVSSSTLATFNFGPFFVLRRRIVL